MSKKLIFSTFLLAYGVLTWMYWPANKNEMVDVNADFIGSYDITGAAGELMRDGCYDCHSYETKYPAYAYFPPVSGWIGGHVAHGRGKLNFSAWSDYSLEEQSEFIKKSIQEIENGDMPPSNYRTMHSEAQWSEQDSAIVLAFLREFAQISQQD
ncbi:MAG: heme-binding domain-containing protein [Ekhidna sp.]